MCNVCFYCAYMVKGKLQMKDSIKSVKFFVLLMIVVLDDERNATQRSPIVAVNDW